MKIIKSFLVLLISVLFRNISNAYYDITNYEIKWDIKTDWTIDVNEKINANFDTSMHWIERILSKYYSVQNSEFQVFYENIDVSWDNFTTYNEYWNTVLRIWDANKTIYGDYNYDIDYSIYWLIRNFSWMWYSELYWNVIWYDWDVDINNVKIQLNLPKAYTWFTKDDFIISLWHTDYYDIDEFPWELFRDDNNIYIIYTWTLQEYNWITLSVKLPNNYFEYDHGKQASLFVWYLTDYEVNNNKVKWTVHKDWSIDFKNKIELIRYNPNDYFYWVLPFKYYEDWKPVVTFLKDLKVNWENIKFTEYDTEWTNQYLNLKQFSWADSLDAEYSIYWLIKPFSWEDENWTHKIYLPLPVFRNTEYSKNIELELEFPESEFSNICSWIFKEDINLKVWWSYVDIDEFYGLWWNLRCENNILYFNTNELYNNETIDLWISLTDIWINLNDELSEALETVWNWEFFYNEDLNNRQSIIFLIWMILCWWWFMRFMNNRYKLQWKEKLKYIIEYVAPKWMDSPETWAVIDDKIDSKDITALIYQWAAARYIKISNEDDKKDKFYIKKLKDLPSNTKEYQLKLFNSLFSKGNEYHFSNNSTSKDYESLSWYITKAKKGLKEYINRQDRYKIDFDYVSTTKSDFKSENKTFVWCTAFLWIIVYCIVVTIINSYLKPVRWWLIFFCILWIVLILSSYKWKEKELNTDKGNEIIKQCLWYKDFLMAVDKDKFETLIKEDPLFVDKALPYAVVFWIQSKFIKNITPESITWFNWDMDNLVTSINYINRSLTYNPYSYSSYSSWGYSSSSYSSSSWHSSWSSFSWWHSSWWGWGWWWWRWW